MILILPQRHKDTERSEKDSLKISLCLRASVAIPLLFFFCC